MKNKNHTLQAYKYFTRNYGLVQSLKQISDERINPRVGLAPSLLSFIISVMSGLHSFNSIEEAIRDGDFRKFIRGERLPSADSFSDLFCMCDLDELEQVLVKTVQKARHNKALKKNSIDGWKVVAIDGFHSFTMTSERLGKDAHTYRIEQKDGSIRKEFRENAIAASYVGQQPRLVLKIRRIPQGEGELTAAKKLLDELNRDHFQYCDLITADSLYANAPFINAVLSNKKDCVIRIKQEDTDLIKDAESLFERRACDFSYRNVTPKDERQDTGLLYDIDIWDEQDFTIWEKVDQPLRVLKVKERQKKVNVQGEIIDEQTQVSYFLTTVEKGLLDAFKVWKIAHRRWDEENSLFHWLKTHWNLDHRYSHKPCVIQVIYTLYAIAYNLFQLYLHRNLRSFNPRKQTKKGFMRRFYRGLVRLDEYLLQPARAPG